MYRFLLLAGALVSSSAFLDALKNFGSQCKDSEFFCGNFECIASQKQCDGSKDCSDGSDEVDCDYYHCKKPDFFRCKNSRCISSSFVCDQQNDCEDFSDEENCKEFLKTLNKNITCAKDEWQCTDKLCIPKEWMCNGERDCLDGSDETLGCSSGLSCDDGFRCKNGHCIFQEWRCDGLDDCRDNSDEENCETEIKPGDCTLDIDRFLCSDGKTCISTAHVCDNKTHCPDQSDEGLSCNTTCTECLHQCFHTPKGPKCLCPQGYHNKNGNFCEDINECEIYGICDQKCKNTPGSYHCFCEENYSLQNDKRNCKAHFGEATMYFSTKKEIRAYFLRSEVYFPVSKNLHQVVGVDFDGTYVYWTDIFSEHESIVRSLKNGHKKELLVTSGLGAPEDLHIDYITKNIYFTDAERQHIGVCTNDGNHCTVLVNRNIHKPRGIVLNSAKGEMYWTDWGHSPLIARSLMDGSHPTPFVTTDIQWPNGIALDRPNSRLYWTDAKLLTLESILLDGTGRRTVLSGIVKHPYAIAVFENRLYWSDWATHSIQSCDKFTGKNHHTVVKEEKEYIYGVTIYHPNNLKEHNTNPCAKAWCSDICLLRGGGYTCACPQGKVLGSNGHVCQEVEKRQRLVLGAGSMLMLVEHKMLGKHQVEALNVLLKSIGAMAYNSIENVLYVSDLEAKRIVAVDMHTGVGKPVGISDFGDIVSMDYDYLGNNLYWCDSQRGTIEVYSFNTQSRTILLHDIQGEVPESLALVPEEGVMYVAFRQSLHRHCHVDRLSMDGTSRTHPMEDGLLGPVALLYDFTLHRIFIADSGTGNIESTSVEGDDRHGFRSLQTAPIGLASLKDDIFWVNLYSKDVYWTNKFNLGSSKYNKKITLDLTDDVDKLHIISITPRRIGLSPCQKLNAGCSHLCLQNQKRIICACPLGLTLDHTNKTCTKRLDCASDEFFCHESNTCISHKFRCDNVKNCPKNEDEQDCHQLNHCPLNYFQCQDGECVGGLKRCDQKYDCRDKSDEHNCSYTEGKQCPPEHFKCKDGRCINERLVCDKNTDCPDEEDEANCVATVCREKEFRCLSGACIPKTWECDHDLDCPDLSDEHAGCPSCNPSTFTCTNGKCIDKSFLCDGENDCGDNSDEISCSRKVTCEGFTCPNTDLCLPTTAVCNGTFECPNKADEKNCFSDCQNNEFSCKNGKCISSEWVCDHTNDCGDFSDENATVCNHTIVQQEVHLLCEDKFQCKSGECINYSLVCNVEHNCLDGSDEDGVCNTSCNSVNNPCGQVCVKTPSGPMCKCEKGYHLQGDGKTCEDVDECTTDPPICAQLCHNIPGFYLCDCYENFALKRDSCKAKGASMSLIFAFDSQIRRMSQMENSLELIYSQVSGRITGLDASGNGTVYFSIENAGTIVKISPTKTEIMEDVGKPRKIALDWVTENIYYVNNEGTSQSISVCSFKNEYCGSLITFDLHRQVSSIAVDATNKFIFYSLVSWWLLNSPNFVIYKANLDGTRVEELVKSSMGYITGISFDQFKRELYFIDQHRGQLSRISYRNPKLRVLKSNLTRPEGLHFFENQLFFQSGSFMKSCRTYGSLECQEFRMKAELFVISQESRQPAGHNPCVNHTCSHICLPSELHYKCLCPNEKLVMSDEKCDTILREGVNDDRRKIVAIHQHEHYSSHSAAIISGVIISVCVILFAFIVFYITKKRNSGTFNVISMRFNNPGYGLHTDDSVRSILQPGQHEYTNPTEFHPGEQAKSEEVLVNV